MKCNVRELAQMSDLPSTIEGRLNYKKVYNGSYRNQTVYKDRWFRLINNYLFYYKISEMGTFDTKNPAGVFIMENSSIQMEHGQNIPFSFSVSFIDEPEKRHLFAARTEENVVQWVMKLRECSYEYLRNRLHLLQSKVFAITGKDPLLLVPRNEGACLWAPAEPFSTAAACPGSTAAFSCHLHPQSPFTLERSKSDVQARRKPHNTTFYTDSVSISTSLAPKVDSNKLNKPQDRIDGIFDNLPYTRAAPSPPARTKLSSPGSQRAMSYVRPHTQHLAGILDVAPVKPQRKISPKPPESNVPVNGGSTRSVPTDSSPTDLIKF